MKDPVIVDVEFYHQVIDQLVAETELSVETEHQYIHELFDAGIPLFKLIFAPEKGDRAALIIVSFHVEIDAPTAILWFLKTRQLCEKLHITGSYMRDKTGQTVLGQDAQALWQQTIEENAKSSTHREVFKTPKKPQTKRVVAVDLRATDNIDDALGSFEDWKPKTGSRSN